MNHITAVVAMLMAFFFQGMAYFGWGVLLGRLLGSPKNPDSPFLPVWLGWAASIFLFHCLNFFFAITAAVVLPVLGTGFLIAGFYVVLQLKRNSHRVRWLDIGGIMIVFLMAGSWIASRAMLSPTFYDAGLYYFNTIRWINTFPAVPGLANLHSRLGFNHSFLMYAASLNVFPFAGHGHSLANSFLLLLFLMTAFLPLANLFAGRKEAGLMHPFHYLPNLFLLPFTGVFILQTSISSPSADTASIFLQLVLFLILFHGIAAVRDGERDQSYRVVFLICMSAAAITVKLSNLAVCAVITLIALAYSWKSTPARRQCTLIALVLALAWGGVWAVRGVVLSGMPIYPSTLGRLPVDWAISADDARDMQNIIYCWARLPRTHFTEVMGSWAWLRPWLHKMTHVPGHIVAATWPVLLSMVFAGTTLCISFYRRVRQRECLLRAEWIVLLPAFAGLLFWFFTAPDPRFGTPVFVQLLIGTSLLFLLVFSGRKALQKRVIAGVFVLSNLLYFFVCADRCDEVHRISLSGWHPVKKVPLIKKQTDSGLEIYLPVTGDQCWDSPLPATPYFNPALRLRTPGLLADGFTVQRTESKYVMPGE